MASQTLTPVDEYLRTSYKPACEYIDGELRPKAMGTKKHGKLRNASPLKGSHMALLCYLKANAVIVSHVRLKRSCVSTAVK